MRKTITILKGTSQYTETVGPIKGLKKIILKRFSIWNTSYIVPTNDFSLTLTVNSITSTFNVPMGMYTISTLLMSIKTFVQAEFSGSDAGFDNLLNQYYLQFNSTSVAYTATEKFIKLFGFSAPRITEVSPGVIRLYFGGVPIISPTTYYKLKITNVNSDDYFLIINDEEIGGLLSLENLEYTIYSDVDYVDKLDFVLYDEYDNIVDLKGSNWIGVFEAEAQPKKCC